jgi:2-iminobutanoate/2-iminopropanoate deaminase
MRTVTVLALSLVLSAACFAEKRVISPKGTAAGRPFSPGILIDGTLYVSGYVGSDSAGKIPSDFEAEVRQCLENIGGVLKEAGMSFDDAVAVQVYLTDIDLFQRMNAVYTKYFKEPRPSRTTVGVTRLAAAGARIEITVTARK